VLSVNSESYKGRLLKNTYLKLMWCADGRMILLAYYLSKALRLLEPYFLFLFLTLILHYSLVDQFKIKCRISKTNDKMIKKRLLFEIILPIITILCVPTVPHFLSRSFCAFTSRRRDIIIIFYYLLIRLQQIQLNFVPLPT
jgi:hypothetical protein